MRATMVVMASTNEEVAALLREYAELLGLTGGDPFRVRNYERAAKSVAGYPDDLDALPDSALTKVPGVRSSIAAKIAGELGVASVSDREQAVRSGRLRGVAGFGPKSEERILRGIAVAASDTALRDALRSLPADASTGDIYAAL